MVECNTLCLAYLEVKVDYFLRVSVGHSLEDLLHVVGGFSLVQKVLLCEVVEKLASVQPAYVCVRECVCVNITLPKEWEPIM